MNKAQKIQNEIYSKMSADQKIQIVNDFYEFSLKLQKSKPRKENDYPKISSSNNFNPREA